MTKLKPFSPRSWLDFLRIKYTEVEAHQDGEIRMDCFLCGKEKHMYVNSEHGTFMCHKCGANGGPAAWRVGLLTGIARRSADQAQLRGVSDYWKTRGLTGETISNAWLGFYPPLDRLTIPYLDRVVGEVHNIAFRAVDGNEGDKYIRLPGVKNGVFILGEPSHEGPTTTIITEGEADALSMYQAYPESYVVGLPGATFINDSLAEVLPPNAKLVAIMDDDAPGKAAEKKLRKRFPSIKVGVPGHGAKDVNDLLVSKGVQAVRERVDTLLLNGSDTNDESGGPVSGASGRRPFRSPAYLALPDDHGTWMIEDLWLDRALGFVAGEPKSMKSMLTLHIGYHVATGTAFCGKRVLHPGPVLLVQEEDNDLTIKTRLRTINSGQGSDNLWLWTPGSVGEHIRLDSDDSLEMLDAAIGEIQPVLVILDPLANLHALESENDAASMNRLLERLRYIRDYRKCSIMVVHHLRKENMSDRGISGQRMRGSSVLHAKSESALYVEKWGDLVRLSVETKMAQGKVIELRFTKQGFIFEDEHGAGVEVDGDGF